MGMVREILVETFVKYYSWRNRRRHPSLLNFFSFFVFVFVFLSATSLRFVCCFVCWYIFSLRFAPLFFSFFFFFHSPLSRSNQLFSAAFPFSLFYPSFFSSVSSSSWKSSSSSTCSNAQKGSSPPKVFSPLYKTYKNPSSSLFSSYIVLIKLAVGGNLLFTKIKIAFSADSFTRFRITYTNCPTVKSLGTRYFFLSKSGTSDFGDFSTITGILSGYFTRMRFDSNDLCSVCFMYIKK